MNDEYQKGKEIGELAGQIKTQNLLLAEHIKEQREWNEIQRKINEKMSGRLDLVEAWIQTTTGKVVVLTSVFAIVGSLAYIGVNWVLNHWSK